MDHGHQTSWLQHIPGLPHEHEFVHVNGAIVVTVGIAIAAVIAHRIIKGRESQFLVPNPKPTFAGFMDIVVEGVYGMIQGTLGPDTKKYFSFLGTVFLFVLCSNFLGLLPFSHAPTSNANTNWAVAAASFVYYNWMGIRAHGLKGYLAHFLMGLGPAGIAIAVVELVSHALRPVTLTLRLYLNLNIDHLMVGTFQNLMEWVLPVPILLFGIVVCTIQAFVFATLSAVYIQMATEHEHHEEHGAAHGHGHH